MRFIVLASYLSTSAILSACSNLPRTLEPEALFPGPSESIDVSGLSTGSDGNVCIKSSKIVENKIPSEATQFAVATFCAYQAQTQEDISFWMVRFVDKGVTLSDYTCSAFFNQLESRRVEVAYSQTNINMGGTAVTAVLAATGSNVRSIFNLATLLTVTNGWFENYKANYVLTPELDKLHTIIQNRLRAPIAGQIREKSARGGYRSFDEAKKDVISYDQLCSHKVLQNVVSESIEKADLRPFSSGADPDNMARASALKQDIYQVASGGTAGDFATGEFEALYVIATTRGDSTQRIKAAKALSELEPKLATYLTKLGLDQPATPAAVSANFQLVGELLSLASSADVRDIRAKIKEKVVATPLPVSGAGAPAIPDLAKLQQQRDTFRAALRSTSPAPAAASINFGYEVRDPRR